jgi:hypothetical protein
LLLLLLLLFVHPLGELAPQSSIELSAVKTIIPFRRCIDIPHGEPVTGPLLRLEIPQEEEVAQDFHTKEWASTEMRDAKTCDLVRFPG